MKRVSGQEGEAPTGDLDVVVVAGLVGTPGPFEPTLLTHQLAIGFSPVKAMSVEESRFRRFFTHVANDALVIEIGKGGHWPGWFVFYRPRGNISFDKLAFLVLFVGVVVPIMRVIPTHAFFQLFDHPALFSNGLQTEVIEDTRGSGGKLAGIAWGVFQSAGKSRELPGSSDRVMSGKDEILHSVEKFTAHDIMKTPSKKAIEKGQSPAVRLQIQTGHGVTVRGIYLREG